VAPWVGSLERASIETTPGRTRSYRPETSVALRAGAAGGASFWIGDGSAATELDCVAPSSESNTPPRASAIIGSATSSAPITAARTIEPRELLFMRTSSMPRR